MAVSPDVATESHTGTAGSASEASFSWSHTGAASGVKGVLVFTFVNANANDALGVTYGGVQMAPVSGGRAVDTVTEPGDCKAWFLSTGVPQGTKTVVVTRNNNANVMYAVACTVLAASNMDTDVHTAGIVLVQEDNTLAEQSVTDGSPGSNSLRYAGVNSGLATPPAQGASSTALQSIDFTSRGCAVVRETTAGQGARSVGFSSGTSDDVAAVHLAVKEIAQSLPTPDRHMAPMVPE
jgi:hypothetical protein